MARAFVLIPGAGGSAWYWHRVAPLLERAGHEAIAVDLPAADEAAGLEDYAETVAAAIGDRTNIVLVASSLAGFTAPLVCARKPVRELVFVNAMIPKPGETAGAWWGNTGAVEARVAAAVKGGYSRDFDVRTYLLHDIPEETLRGGPLEQPPQAETIFAQPCRFQRWPDIPTRVIASTQDRLFPLEFQRRVGRERLDVEPMTLPGGHLVALSNPEALADLLMRTASAD